MVGRAEEVEGKVIVKECSVLQNENCVSMDQLNLDVVLIAGAPEYV